MRTSLFALLASSLLITACGDSGSSTATDAAQTPTPTPTVAATETAAPETPAAEEEAIDLSALPAPYNEANYANGERIFKQCATCHRLNASDGHRVGPNLHGLFGRTAGYHDDFDYSDAVKDADFEWTPEMLEEWLEKPKEFLPGNRMRFAGVRRENDRHDVIAYLLIETGK